MAVAEAIYERAFEGSFLGCGEAEKALWLAVADEAIRVIKEAEVEKG